MVVDAALCAFALGYMLGTLGTVLLIGLFGPKRGHGSR